MIHAVDTLMNTLGCACAFVTLGEHGACIHAPSRVWNTFIERIEAERSGRDGAGDTVIATAALMRGWRFPESIAAVANLAGGWVCEKVGVVPMVRGELERELTRLSELKRTTE